MKSEKGSLGIVVAVGVMIIILALIIGVFWWNYKITYGSV